MKLTSDDVLWFVYQYNCSVGHPALVPRKAFEREFSVEWNSIAPIVNELVDVDRVMTRRWGRIYDLTEKGLQKVQKMSKHMPNDVRVIKRFWEEIGQWLIDLYEKAH